MRDTYVDAKVFAIKVVYYDICYKLYFKNWYLVALLDFAK